MDVVISPALISNVVVGCHSFTVVLTNDSNTHLNITNLTWVFTDDYVSNNVTGVSDVSLSAVSTEAFKYDTVYSQNYEVYNHPDANYT